MNYKERARTMLQFHSKKLSNEKVGYDDNFMFDRFHVIPEGNLVAIDEFWDSLDRSQEFERLDRYAKSNI